MWLGTTLPCSTMFLSTQHQLSFVHRWHRRYAYQYNAIWHESRMEHYTSARQQTSCSNSSRECVWTSCTAARSLTAGQWPSSRSFSFQSALCTSAASATASMYQSYLASAGCLIKFFWLNHRVVLCTGAPTCTAEPKSPSHQFPIISTSMLSPYMTYNKLKLNPHTWSGKCKHQCHAHCHMMLTDTTFTSMCTIFFECMWSSACSIL